LQPLWANPLTPPLFHPQTRAKIKISTASEDLECYLLKNELCSIKQAILFSTGLLKSLWKTDPGPDLTLGISMAFNSLHHYEASKRKRRALLNHAPESAREEVEINCPSATGDGFGVFSRASKQKRKRSCG
jgi:hypothetical protein